MDIEANCGCGAKVKLSPRSHSFNGYDSTALGNAEREAVALAFREWVQAHGSCGKPRIEYGSRPSPFDVKIAPLVDEPTL